MTRHMLFCLTSRIRGWHACGAASPRHQPAPDVAAPKAWHTHRFSVVALLTLLTATAATADPPASRDVPDLGKRKQGVDWPRFLGPQGDSTSTEKGIIAPWPKKGLRVVWQAKTGTGYAMPTVSKGRLFLFARHGNRNRLTCLKSETGQFLLHFDYPTDFQDKYGYDGPRCSPLVDGDRVYLFGPEGMLFCIGVLDGKQVWTIDTGKKFNVIQNFFGVGSTPVIEGDLLIAQIGGSPAGSDPDEFGKLKGNGSGVVAFNKYTGKVVYKITDELASYASPVLATINGRRSCFVFARGGLVGFEPATGKVDFHFPWRAEDLESVNASNPVVVGNKVFIGETYGPGGALVEVLPGKCKALWTDAKKSAKQKSMACHWMTPVYDDGYLYGCSGRHTFNAFLQCIDFNTGKIQWSVPRLNRTSLLYVDGHFIALEEYGELILFKANPKKFEVVSRLRVTDPKTDEDLLEYPCWAAPILSHGLLYVRGDQRLVCLELIPEKKG